LTARAWPWWDSPGVRDLQGVSLDNTATVETPERIRFTHHVAGPVRRALAYAIDLLIRGAVLLLASILSTGVMTSASVKASWGLWLLVLFALEWGWNVLFESFWNGRTPGKRALGLRVVRDGGYPIGFIDAVLRNLLRAADFLPAGYLIGLGVMAVDRRSRRLGDLVAGTMVVIETPSTVASPISVTPAPTADELNALPPRPPLTADELEAIELFLRRTHLSQQRRAELAEMVVPTLAQRMGLRPSDPIRFLGLLHQRATGTRRPLAGAAPPRAP
jgi:uncharacterized RDD family membrane protein YckC